MSPSPTTTPGSTVTLEARTPALAAPYLSVVIPVYNEQENLPTLYQSLSQVLKNLGKTYEIIWVDDGSADR